MSVDNSSISGVQRGSGTAKDQWYGPEGKRTSGSSRGAERRAKSTSWFDDWAPGPGTAGDTVMTSGGDFDGGFFNRLSGEETAPKKEKPTGLAAALQRLNDGATTQEYE